MTTRKKNQPLPNCLYYFLNVLKGILLLLFFLSNNSLKSQTFLRNLPCYAVAEDNGAPNFLYEYAPVSEQWIYVGETGTDFIEAIATDPINDIIYAVDGGQLGTLDTNTGAFLSIGEGVGSGNGQIGIILFDDIDGLSYDPNNKILWASQRMPGSGPGTNDLILKIDQATGAFIPNEFINGDDYAVVQEAFDGTFAGDVYDVDDIAYNPYTGILYAIQNQDGPGLITELNQFDGSVEQVIIDFPDDDVEGLGISFLGELYATTGDNAATGSQNAFIFIDIINGRTTMLNEIDPTGEAVDFESFDCFTGFNDLAIQQVIADNQPQPIGDGDIVTFEITIYNQGDITNQDILLSSYIPMGLSLVDPNWTVNRQVANLTIPGPLTPGDKVTVTLELRIDPGFNGVLTNYVEITQSFNNQIINPITNERVPLPDVDSTPDNLNQEANSLIKEDEINGSGPYADEDEDDHDITVLEVGNTIIFDLALTKQTNTTIAFPNDDVTFTITIYNQGSVDATNIVISDYIPNGFILSPNDANGWLVASSSNAITNIPGPLPSGASTIIDIVLQVNDSGTGEVVNLAEITSFEDTNSNTPSDIDSTPDNDPNNDGEPTDNEINNANGDEDDHDFASVNIGLRCYELSVDTDDDNVPDDVDLDTDNDGILDVDEDGALEQRGCSTPDLTALEGGSVANTTLTGVTIGGATITLTNTFTGGASQDEDIINNSQTTGDLGIRQGVIDSPDAKTQMFNTYTFSQPVCNLSMTVWDIDRTDILTVEGSNGGTSVTINVLNPGTLLDSVTGSGTTLITANEADNLQDPGGTDYGFTVVFDECVDQVVYTFNNGSDAGNTGGSYSITFNEGCDQSVTNSDKDGDGVPNFLDLDSDNDGIPDAIEACGNIDLNLENCRLDSNGNGQYETNADGCSNGLLLDVCNQVPIDSDNDGTPDYLDLDSDNDGCADAVESLSNANPNVNMDTFLNPSVDINGLVFGANLTGSCVRPLDISWYTPNAQSEPVGGCDDGDCSNGIETWNGCACTTNLDALITGCTDSIAINYSSTANCDDGSCINVEIMVEQDPPNPSVGAEFCTTITIMDDSDNILENVGVNIASDDNSANNYNADFTSNEYGQVEFCYTGSVAGYDGCIVTAGNFTQTFGTNWIIPGQPSDCNDPRACNYLSNELCVYETCYYNCNYEVINPETFPATLCDDGNPLTPESLYNQMCKCQGISVPFNCVITCDPPSVWVGSDYCFIATVTDTLYNEPLTNVPVSFVVTGANTFVGSVSTNENGEIELCYPTLNIGLDSINIFCGPFEFNLTATCIGPGGLDGDTQFENISIQSITGAVDQPNPINQEVCTIITIENDFLEVVGGVQIQIVSSFNGVETYNNVQTTNFMGQINLCTLSSEIGIEECIISSLGEDGETILEEIITIEYFDPTTDTVEFQKEEPGLVILNIIPMPVNEQFDLLLTHHQSEAVQIEIHNHIGQLVYQEAHQLNPQINILQLNVADLSGGVHLLSVKVANKVVSKKLLKY